MYKLFEVIQNIWWRSVYMSPKYAMKGICSTKADVYSFGVLLLEIVCGRKNNSFYDVDRPLNLVGYVCEISLIEFFPFSILIVVSNSIKLLTGMGAME
ncbi:putative protein kinase RLK-Pelle-DLSV family [Medicago truncatula]|uniref:Serine-threonine/tyrosine-protein kinase catalytic domain-containing protein n=1 Tax=Medicago truncatula TaxID=3880 RepID=A0A396GJL4_MEDTR|nr:putative protein kinase RLK-Pelle-DLSV family [Medicago truncatula]